MKKVIVTTGGTAGHIFPAYATIEALKEKYPLIEVLFVGSSCGQEEKIMKEKGIPFVGLPVRGFMGKGIKSIKALYFLCIAFWKALILCKKFKPDVIIGFGGYACFPSVLAGALLSIPSVLHEQNIVPGTANRILSKFVTRVCVSFPETTSCFTSKNIMLTGNPTRNSYVASAEKLASAPSKNMLVLGGSLGAIRINTFIVDIAPKLLEMGVSIRHQTGKKDFEIVCDSYKEMGLAGLIQVDAFIDDMHSAYQWADFAVCRAGASTIFELASMAVPAIFIPFPHAINNHQWHNAQGLVQENASFCLKEKGLTNEQLLETIAQIVEPKVLCEMRERIYAKRNSNATELVVLEIEKCVF